MGGATRVLIQSGEDIRHLGELDKKQWTVMSCPVEGLEISAESLKLIDGDGDGKLRIKEVVATAEWLCANLKNPNTLLEQSDVLALDNIADEAIKAVAEKIAKDGKIALSDVRDAIAAVTIEEQVVPAAPFEADVIAAYKEKSAEYAAYFELEKLQKLGLATIAEDAAKPGMKEADFLKMGDQIATWEAAKAAAEGANAAALDAAQAEFMPLRKLLLLHRDFYRLLKNFVTLEDFYNYKPEGKLFASFQAGTLFIDQRASHLCIRVSDLPKHDTQAPLSGIYLMYCNCENKKTGKKMQIVAAMSQGDIKNLGVGKNGVFYDNDGLDYDASVFKIIENPISILQAFWTPYRKMSKWIEDKINKSASEKDAAVMNDMTATADAKTGGAPAEDAPKSTFDIAKFAGIFAAIGMALGMLASALVAILHGLIGLPWWAYIAIFVGIILIISGPSMVMAWMKLRRRNLAPVLNANGWAVNADAKISIPFGRVLTEKVSLPVIKSSRKGLWIGLVCCMICLGVGGWCLYKHLNKPAEEEETTEVVAEATDVTEETANEAGQTNDQTTGVEEADQ